MSPEAKRGLQLLAGAAVVFFVVLMFLRGTHLVGDAMSPTLADGNVGAPPLAAVAVVEFLISALTSLGAFVIGGIAIAYNWIRSKFEPENQRRQPDKQGPVSNSGPSLSARGMIAHMEKPPSMNRDEVRTWRSILVKAAHEGDYQSVIRASEKLAGSRFFPRADNTSAQNEG